MSKREELQEQLREELEEQLYAGRLLAHATTGGSLPDDMSMADWEAVGRVLAAQRDTNTWAIADWIRHVKWGARYGDGSRITGLSVQRLMNIASVARRFETSRRRENLSFYHHEVVARFEPETQDKWLDRAEASGWSGTRLATETGIQMGIHHGVEPLPRQRRKAAPRGFVFPKSSSATSAPAYLMDHFMRIQDQLGRLARSPVSLGASKLLVDLADEARDAAEPFVDALKRLGDAQDEMERKAREAASAAASAKRLADALEMERKAREAAQPELGEAAPIPASHATLAPDQERGRAGALTPLGRDTKGVSFRAGAD